MRRITALGSWALAMLLVAPTLVQAGGLLVAPTRLVLEHGGRHGEFVLLNKGESTKRYRLSLAFHRMTKEGRVVPVEEPAAGERPADAMVRFSPRRVVLPPDEPQSVRVLVRRPGDLPAGEYRTHLLFQEIPDAPPAAPAHERPARGVQIQITPIFGISVPIIVRHGRLEAQARLADLSLTEAGGTPQLALRIQRRGTRSIYGDVQVRHDLPGESPRVVGQARGVALYTPNRERPLTLDLAFPGARVPAEGRLVVEYRDAESGASGLLAEADLALAGR